MSMFDLSGKVAVVTGGNGGIGLGMALGLAEAGADLVIAGRNPEKNATAVAQIEKRGVKAIAVPTDVRDPNSCKELIVKTMDAFGRVDILVNNSGINYRKTPEDFTLEEWHDVIDTNLTAAFVLSKEVYPHFVAQGGGKIINVASIAAFSASPAAVAYSPSKGGLAQLGKALAVSWGKDNIQINSVLPGWIDTELSQSARKTFPGLEESIVERTPAGRWGTPADFAGAAVYFASSASDFVSGSSLVIDGAYTSKT